MSDHARQVEDCVAAIDRALAALPAHTVGAAVEAMTRVQARFIGGTPGKVTRRRAVMKANYQLYRETREIASKRREDERHARLQK